MKIEKYGSNPKFLANVKFQEISGSSPVTMCVGEISSSGYDIGNLAVDVFNSKIPVNSSFIIYLTAKTKGVMIGYKYQVEGYGNFILMAYGGLFNHYWFENGVLKAKVY